MFTGIVQGTAKLVSIDEKPNFRTHVVELPDHMLDGLETGASVAHNGCCLTVTWCRLGFRKVGWSPCICFVSIPSGTGPSSPCPASYMS